MTTKWRQNDDSDGKMMRMIVKPNDNNDDYFCYHFLTIFGNMLLFLFWHLHLWIPTFVYIHTL